MFLWAEHSVSALSRSRQWGGVCYKATLSLLPCLPKSNQPGQRDTPTPLPLLRPPFAMPCPVWSFANWCKQWQTRQPCSNPALCSNLWKVRHRGPAVDVSAWLLAFCPHTLSLGSLSHSKKSSSGPRNWGQVWPQRNSSTMSLSLSPRPLVSVAVKCQTVYWLVANSSNT